jgi:uncharacterized peroxidase-related enzyme
MPRLAPLTDQAIDDEAILERFAHYARTRGFTPNSIRTMARRPAIVKAFMALNQAVLYEGTVPTALKMLVATATSLAAGCRYCRSHMTNLSAIYDAGDLRIAALWDFEQADCFSAADRAALIVAYRAGMTPNGVEDGDVARLREHFDDGQVVEIIATIALFGFLNRWNDTLATSLEDHPKAVTERILGATGWDAGKHGD